MAQTQRVPVDQMLREAQQFQKMHGEDGKSVAEIADDSGYTEVTVRRRLRMAALEPEVFQAMRDGLVTPHGAREWNQYGREQQLKSLEHRIGAEAFNALLERLPTNDETPATRNDGSAKLDKPDKSATKKTKPSPKRPWRPRLGCSIGTAIKNLRRLESQEAPIRQTDVAAAIEVATGTLSSWSSTGRLPVSWSNLPKLRTWLSLFRDDREPEAPKPGDVGVAAAAGAPGTEARGLPDELLDEGSPSTSRELGNGIIMTAAIIVPQSEIARIVKEQLQATACVWLDDNRLLITKE